MDSKEQQQMDQHCESSLDESFLRPPADIGFPQRPFHIQSKLFCLFLYTALLIWHQRGAVYRRNLAKPPLSLRHWSTLWVVLVKGNVISLLNWHRNPCLRFRHCWLLIHNKCRPAGVSPGLSHSCVTDREQKIESASWVNLCKSYLSIKRRKTFH